MPVRKNLTVLEKVTKKVKSVQQNIKIKKGKEWLEKTNTKRGYNTPH
jgi:hypothetical protein